jgi:hypothetical protein
MTDTQTSPMRDFHTPMMTDMPNNGVSNVETPRFFYFNRDQQCQEELVRRAFTAAVAREDRRRHWLTERRKEQREAAKKALVHQRLKLRTEKIAARFTNDPSMVSGGRLAAATHAETRKIGGKLYSSIKSLYIKPTVFCPASPTINIRPQFAPSKNNRAGSISSVPVLLKIREELPQSLIFNWDDMEVPHSATWKYAGRKYSSAEIFEVVAKKIAMADEFKRRMDQCKVFERSMDAARKLLLDCARIGSSPDPGRLWQLIPPIPSKQQPTKNVFDPAWKRDAVIRHVYENLERQEARRLANMLTEEEMEVDALDGWSVMDGMVIAPHNVSWNGGWVDLNDVSIAEFNGASMEQCGQLCQTMNIAQLKFLRQHLTQLKEEGQGHVNKEKWSGLNKEIAQRGKQQRNKWGNQRQDDAWGRNGRRESVQGQNQNHWGRQRSIQDGQSGGRLQNGGDKPRLNGKNKSGPRNAMTNNGNLNPNRVNKNRTNGDGHGQRAGNAGGNGQRGGHGNGNGQRGNGHGNLQRGGHRNGAGRGGGNANGYRGNHGGRGNAGRGGRGRGGGRVRGRGN